MARRLWFSNVKLKLPTEPSDPADLSQPELLNRDLASLGNFLCRWRTSGTRVGWSRSSRDSVSTVDPTSTPPTFCVSSCCSSGTGVVLVFRVCCTVTQCTFLLQWRRRQTMKRAWRKWSLQRKGSCPSVVHAAFRPHGSHCSFTPLTSTIHTRHSHPTISCIDRATFNSRLYSHFLHLKSDVSFRNDNFTSRILQSHEERPELENKPQPAGFWTQYKTLTVRNFAKIHKGDVQIIRLMTVSVSTLKYFWRFSCQKIRFSCPDKTLRVRLSSNWQLVAMRNTRRHGSGVNQGCSPVRRTLCWRLWWICSSGECRGT